MGMYTRLVLNVAVRETAPIITELCSMVRGEGTHGGRRAWMLGSSSHYHDNINSKSIEYDEVSKCWKLSVCCDLKNYEDEIQWFLDFIAPYVKTQDLAGYVRYEENEAPDLIWFKEGKRMLFTPELPAALQ